MGASMLGARQEDEEEDVEEIAELRTNVYVWAGS